MRNEKNRLKCDSERFRKVLLVLLHCARSSLTLTRAVQRPAMLQCTRAGRCTAAFCGANQHNHGLLVSWALQGEGMACAPWYVR
ncbi:TPA: hypothetical protein ACH6GH_003482 [Escherichia coli]